MDLNSAAAWRDLYIGMVGAGASLTGLTFVAIALDPRQIERTPRLRLRASSAVWCFVSVMFIGIAVLTPRPFAAVAAAVVGVGGLAGAVLLFARTVRQRKGWVFATLALASVIMLVSGIFRELVAGAADRGAVTRETDGIPDQLSRRKDP
jgi:hypothetical protein